MRWRRISVGVRSSSCWQTGHSQGRCRAEPPEGVCTASSDGPGQARKAGGWVGSSKWAGGQVGGWVGGWLSRGWRTTRGSHGAPPPQNIHSSWAGHAEEGPLPPPRSKAGIPPKAAQAAPFMLERADPPPRCPAQLLFPGASVAGPRSPARPGPSSGAGDRQASSWARRSRGVKGR